MAGLDVPDRWDLTALERLHHDCQHKASSQDATPDLRRAADMLEALCLAAGRCPCCERSAVRLSALGSCGTFICAMSATVPMPNL